MSRDVVFDEKHMLKKNIKTDEGFNGNTQP